MEEKKRQKELKPIIVMLSYARSGGTLLNRCMGSIPNTLVLSEINTEAICPNSCRTIKEQAKKWYNINLKSKTFLANIKELYKYCNSHNKTLLIRDWTFGSYVPSQYNNFQPTKSLATLKILSKNFPVISFAFVRDPIDVWLSLQDSPRTFYDKNLEFLHELSKSLIENKIKIFKYEDFCKEPIKEMKKICRHTKIKYNKLFLDYNNFTNVTGDIDLPDASRGIKQGKITLLPRRKTFKKFSKYINSETKAKEIKKLLNYN